MKIIKKKIAGGKMETIVNFVAGYGTILIGDLFLAELLGICSIVLVVGIAIGRWSKKTRTIVSDE